jgi:N-acetylmuramoyl-L-alanine amidase
MTIKWMDDPGHGGQDPGAVGNELREKDIVLKIALMNRDIIKAYDGIEHRLTRSTDVFLSLQERVGLANQWGADYFSSIHVNAAGTPAANGYEDFVANIASSRSVAFRNVMHDEIRKKSPEFTNRGKKSAGFYVITNTRMPAILTENGFISSPKDAALLKDENFLYRIAEGHVNGVVKNFGLRKKVIVPVSTSEKEVVTVSKQENHTPSPTHAKAWEKATKLGVFNGEDPKKPISRQQMATVLDRLGLLK